MSGSRSNLATSRFIGFKRVTLRILLTYTIKNNSIKNLKNGKKTTQKEKNQTIKNP